MLTSPDISDALILLTAAAAMEGKINEDASFGLRVYEQVLKSLDEDTISQSCLDNLESLDPKRNASGVIVFRGYLRSKRWCHRQPYHEIPA